MVMFFDDFELNFGMKFFMQSKSIVPPYIGGLWNIDRSCPGCIGVEFWELKTRKVKVFTMDVTIELMCNTLLSMHIPT